MKTFQDLQAVGENIKDRMEFVRTAITDYEGSDMYKTASLGWDYYRQINTTIMTFKKWLYKTTGEAIEDIWGANYKIACGHFKRFVTYEVQHLLGNGVRWNKEETAKKLGTKEKSLDSQMNIGATKSKWGGVSFGFWNKDHIEFFSALEFVPLLDEETGGLRAGIRFWQVDNTKPLRAFLYEEDGYTEMMFYKPSDKFTPSKEWQIVDNDVGLAVKKKSAYIVKATGDSKDRMDGTEIIEGENYPEFPIVPLWCNKAHQGEIVGLRPKLDCYDVILSGFANNVDEASIFYWTLQNAGGLDDVDTAKFIEQMKMLHVTDLPEGVTAQANTMDAPFNSREAFLGRLDKDIYRDAMVVDVDNIANGAINEVQLRAAYEPMNQNTDDFEYCVLEFLYRIMSLAGVDDEPTFTRSEVSNQNERINTLLQAGEHLPSDFITREIATILGHGDKAESIIADMHREELNRYTDEETEENEENI